MAKATPLQIVKEKFGSKEKLVAQLSEVLEPRDGESKEELQERLKSAANAKLLHLHGVAESAKALGGRKAMSQEIATHKGLGKDKDFHASLEAKSLSTLVDMVNSLRRAKKNN